MRFCGEAYGIHLNLQIWLAMVRRSNTYSNLTVPAILVWKTRAERERFGKTLQQRLLFSDLEHAFPSPVAGVQAFVGHGNLVQ
jgi:hypothetical protein